MESLGNGSLTPTELQCPPEKNVGRRSVEVTKVVEELYGPPDESREWRNEVSTTGRSPGCIKHAKCVLNNISLDSECGLEDSVHQLKEDIKEFIEPDTIMETKMCEPQQETDQPKHAGGSRVSTLQIATLGDKASRGSLSKKKADGYEAAFLRNKTRGAGKMSGSSSMSSPTESLEDLLYRKTKRVLDYSVADMRGQRSEQSSASPSEYMRMPPMIQSSSGAPSVAYSKRTEHTVTQARVVRRKEDSRHSLQVKVNKAWVEPAKRGYDSRATTQRADPASGQQPVRKSSDIIRKEKKGVYYTELSRQVQERSQMMERERRKNADADRRHNETMQFGIWGKLGGGAPNPAALRRTKFSSTGITSQEQVPHRGFAGTPFHLRF